MSDTTNKAWQEDAKAYRADAHREYMLRSGFTEVKQPIAYDIASPPAVVALSEVGRKMHAAFEARNEALERAARIEMAQAALRESLKAQTDVTLVLYEKLREVAGKLESVAWRKRRVDHELECVACHVLKSSYGGNHAPGCWIALVERTAKPSPEMERAYRLMRMRELLPHDR